MIVYLRAAAPHLTAPLLELFDGWCARLPFDQSVTATGFPTRPVLLHPSRRMDVARIEVLTRRLHPHALLLDCNVPFPRGQTLPTPLWRAPSPRTRPYLSYPNAPQCLPPDRPATSVRTLAAWWLVPPYTCLPPVPSDVPLIVTLDILAPERTLTVLNHIRERS